MIFKVLRVQKRIVSVETIRGNMVLINYFQQEKHTYLWWCWWWCLWCSKPCWRCLSLQIPWENTKVRIRMTSTKDGEMERCFPLRGFGAHISLSMPKMICRWLKKKKTKMILTTRFCTSRSLFIYHHTGLSSYLHKVRKYLELGMYLSVSSVVEF